ncbi:hypothetical protein V8B97DRAFT_1867281 [Scleroderma yunnanense]
MPSATEVFNNVLMRLLEQREWAIEAHRNYLNTNFPRSTTLTLCAITFLTMAEMMRLRYARHPPEDLQAGAGSIQYGIFLFMSAIPVLGVIVIRVIEVFTVSQSIIITICFMVVTAMPGEILPAVLYFFHRVRNWVGRSRWEQGNDVEAASLPEQAVLRERHFAPTEVQWIAHW